MPEANSTLHSIYIRNDDGALMFEFKPFEVVSVRTAYKFGLVPTELKKIYPLSSDSDLARASRLTAIYLLA